MLKIESLEPCKRESTIESDPRREGPYTNLEKGQKGKKGKREKGKRAEGEREREEVRKKKILLRRGRCGVAE